MAIETLVTTSAYPEFTSDLVTLKECRMMLKRTGHPVAETTMRTWISDYGLTAERNRRGALLVSYSAMLMAHRDWVARKD